MVDVDSMLKKMLGNKPSMPNFKKKEKEEDEDHDFFKKEKKRRHKKC
jgi:hypothetical protein